MSRLYVPRQILGRVIHHRPRNVDVAGMVVGQRVFIQETPISPEERDIIGVEGVVVAVSPGSVRVKMDEDPYNIGELAFDTHSGQNGYTYRFLRYLWESRQQAEIHDALDKKYEETRKMMGDMLREMPVCPEHISFLDLENFQESFKNLFDAPQREFPSPAPSRKREMDF